VTRHSSRRRVIMITAINQDVPTPSEANLPRCPGTAVMPHAEAPSRHRRTCLTHPTQSEGPASISSPAAIRSCPRRPISPTKHRRSPGSVRPSLLQYLSNLAGAAYQRTQRRYVALFPTPDSSRSTRPFGKVASRHMPGHDPPHSPATAMCLNYAAASALSQVLLLSQMAARGTPRECPSLDQLP
jgi:hypothetical protein